MAEICAETKDVVEQRTYREANDKMPAGVGAISDETVDELRYAIDDTHQ